MNEYKTKIIRKYLTTDGVYRDTPAFIRYEHTKTKEDLLKLLDEYSEDVPFLSISLIDEVLDKIEYIQDSIEDRNSLEHCFFFYNQIWETRDSKYRQLVHDNWAGEVLYQLLDDLSIEEFDSTISED